MQPKASNLRAQAQLTETETKTFDFKEKRERLRCSPKGTRWSHSGMAIHVAEQIAALKNVPVKNVLQTTRKNTRFVYNV
ncbi:hypothetical protein TNCV_428191 [Trichonephila clavipes]|nr:hypothetical protein TNCV_428191 [Trichonephila clavipes]